MDEEEYFKKTVIMLKQMLDDRGLSKVGKKAELVARLLEDDTTASKTGQQNEEAESEAVKQTDVPEEKHSLEQPENQNSEENMKESSLQAPPVTTASISSSQSVGSMPEHVLPNGQMQKEKEESDQEVITGFDQKQTVQNEQLSDGPMSSRETHEDVEIKAKSGADGAEESSEAVKPADATEADRPKNQSTESGIALNDTTNRSEADDSGIGPEKIHGIDPASIASDSRPTVTEALISEIQKPAKPAAIEDSDDKPFDTAVGPSVPMALNVLPNPPSVPIESEPADDQIAANDPEILKRKREIDESDVQSKVIKRPKNVSEQDPIGGSSLLKEEVPAYQEQVLQSSIDSRAQHESKPDGNQSLPASVHLATEGLYIAGLTRPINSEALSEHLRSICGESPKSLYLDSIKSHAYVAFSSTEAASSARLGLHGQIWPSEPQRKALWVDFLPVASINEFTKREEQSARGSRWEVVYPEKDGNVTAFLQEVGTNVDRSNAIEQTGEPQASDQQSSKPSKKVIRLDELFKKTTAKPVLYYTPAKSDVIEKRLQKLENNH